MAHKRKSIRDYAVSALETAFGANAVIYNARYLAPKAEEAITKPVITVFTPDDSSELLPDDAIDERYLVIEVVFFVTGDEEHEEIESGALSLVDRLDSAAETIEETLSGFRETFGGLVYKVIYDGITTEVTGAADSGYVVGVGVIRFRAKYHNRLDS